MASGGEPPEITALSTNLSSITDTLTAGGSLQWFADCLVERAFITREAASGIRDTTGISPAEKASKLMDSVFAKINGSDNKRHWFHEFVDMFSHDRAYAELVERLRIPGAGAGNQRQSGDPRVELGRQSAAQQGHLLGERVTLTDLQRFPTPVGTINILQRVGPDYKPLLGNILLKDHNGQRIRGIEMTNSNIVDLVVYSMFQKWCTEDEGCTWGALVLHLNEANLRSLASDIESALI